MKKILLRSATVFSSRRGLAAAAMGLTLIASVAAQAATPVQTPSPPAAAPTAGCADVKNAQARKTCEDARAEFSKGNYSLSLTMMAKALEASPKEGILRLQIARILVRLDDLARAERQARLARQSGAPDAAVLPVLFYAMLGKHKEAVLLNEFPEPAAGAKGDIAAEILRGRAMALQSTDRLAEAATAMDRSLSLRRDTDGLLLRASIANQQKDSALTAKLVDEAYRMAPTDAGVMVAKIEQLEKANDAAGILALSDRMIKLYPLNSDPRVAKIKVFLKQKQDAKAMAEVDAILKQRPKSLVGAFYKAVLASHSGDKKGAAIIIQGLPPEYVKRYPENAIQMAQIVADNGNIEQSASILAAALAATPDQLDVRLRLATVRLQQESPQSALLLLGPVKDSQDSRVQKLISQARARIAKDRAF